MNDLKYYDGEKKKGIVYDFNLIRKEFKKLKTPKDVYNPLTIPLDSAKYFLLLSERGIGKTTQLLLLGLCMHKLYGTTITYIRQKELMLMPKYSGTLFDVIKKFGYIEILTDGEYNTLYYKSRRWYYAKTNENGEIAEICPDFICYMASLDQTEEMKSGLNLPIGDFILFDEFIGSYYYPDEFVKFEDLISTIIRKRYSPIIFLSANTIDPYSPYFREFEIEDDIHKMELGDNILVTTDRGTKIYVELIKDVKSKSKVKSFFNSLFFGFKNPKLTAITGDGNWALDSYPHPPKDFDRVHYGIFIEFHGKLCALDICENENVGYFVLCHRATRTYEDSVIFVDRQELTRCEVYDIKEFDIGKTIIDFYTRRKFYYTDNTLGNLVTNFFMSKNIRL